ncbi:unnamed protein product [Effrenium voratum]|nr:unnamed protein product [Effrenium voratum]
MLGSLGLRFPRSRSNSWGLAWVSLCALWPPSRLTSPATFGWPPCASRGSGPWPVVRPAAATGWASRTRRAAALPQRRPRLAEPGILGISLISALKLATFLAGLGSGLSYSPGNSDLYTNLAFFNGADSLAYVLVLGADVFGRRLMQGGGFGLLCCGVFSGPGLIACAMAGHIFLNVCFTTIYVELAAVFPESAKRTAPVCQVAARVGVLAPLATPAQLRSASPASGPSGRRWPSCPRSHARVRLRFSTSLPSLGAARKGAFASASGHVSFPGARGPRGA